MKRVGQLCLKNDDTQRAKASVPAGPTAQPDSLCQPWSHPTVPGSAQSQHTLSNDDLLPAVVNHRGETVADHHPPGAA